MQGVFAYVRWQIARLRYPTPHSTVIGFLSWLKPFIITLHNKIKWLLFLNSVYEETATICSNSYSWCLNLHIVTFGSLVMSSKRCKEMPIHVMLHGLDISSLQQRQ